MSTHFLQHQSSSPQEDSIWSLAWTPQNQIISTTASGHLSLFTRTSPSTSSSSSSTTNEQGIKPTKTIQVHPLGTPSLSVDSTGKRVLVGSVDGGVALVAVGEDEDEDEGLRVVARKETYKDQSEDGVSISSFSSAIHPSSRQWASTGQSARIGFYTLPEVLHAGGELPGGTVYSSKVGGEGEEDDDEERVATRGKKGGEGPGLGALEKVVEGGKSKFGMCLRYSPDGKSLAMSTESGQIMILDSETRNVVATHTSHAMCVRTLSWSGDSQYLFSGSDDKRIVLHDVRAGSAGSAGRGSAAVAELKGHASWVLSLGASPDGRALVSGGADSTLRLWDVSQRACLSTTQAGTQVWAVDWQPIQADQTRVGKDYVWGGEDAKVNWMRSAGSGA